MQDTQLQLDDLIEALSDPDAYPRQVDGVEHLQTHISVLFFAGDRVYKLKKPVELDFLDYTAVEDRRRFCEEEVRLNRRISPRMYHGVRPVTREPEGRVVVDGDGDVVDWVVEMDRLPADRMLDALLDADAVEDEQLERVADVLVRFHGRAMTGPSVNRFGITESVVAGLEENVDQLEGVAERHPDAVPSGALRFLRERVRAFVRDHRDLFERRVAQWRIREGHGDLHAGNVCLVGDDVLVYDCVEFDRGLRCGDVASDLAFLAMDLDHRGYREAAGHLVATYARRATDPDLDLLVAFYATHRALVRAKVELLTSEDEGLDDADRRAAEREARRYLHLALGYELPACLVLVAGPPGDARTRTAAYLAGRLRAHRTRCDPPAATDAAAQADGNGAARGVPAGEREALERAVEALSEGASSVVEGSFAQRALRRPFEDAAARLDVPCLLLVLADPPDGGAEADEPDGDVPGALLLRRSADAAPEDHAGALLERALEDLAHRPRGG